MPQGVGVQVPPRALLDRFGEREFQRVGSFC